MAKLGQKKGIDRDCLKCGKSFYVTPCRINDKTRSKYCSKSCSKKGQVGYWIGKTRSKEDKKKMSGERLQTRDENNYAWRGEKVSYRNLHRWVERRLGKPTECTECKTVGLTGHEIHWANISGIYKRKLEDWVRLCAQCHKTFDLSRN